jgi:copper chaperone
MAYIKDFVETMRNKYLVMGLERKMKKLGSILIGLISSYIVNMAWASEPIESAIEVQSRFEIRADGLACPYCAYGIEKKFMAIEGVKSIDVDLKKGQVKVNGVASLSFNEQQLKTLFTDSGFTYRSMKKLENKTISDKQ